MTTPDLPEIPAFSPSFVPVIIDEDTVHIRAGPWSGPVLTISDSDREGYTGQLFRQIDGDTPLDEILGGFPEEDRPSIVQTLTALVERNIIYDRQSMDVSDRCTHHALQQNRFELPEEVRDSLGTKDVLLVDGGGVGATQLAKDLQSYDVQSVGYLQLDAESRELSLAEGNRSYAVYPDELEDAIETVDFVVYSADRPRLDILSRINEHTHQTETPWSSVQVYGLDAIVGPTVFPGETACYSCFMTRMRSNVSGLTGFDRYMQSEHDQSTVAEPLVRTAAGYLGMDLPNLLAYRMGFTTQRVVSISALDLSVEGNEVLKLPRCEVCGANVGDARNQFVAGKDIARLQQELKTEREGTE